MPSSVIASFEYDPVKSVLRVKYVSGITYEYDDVPETIYTTMKNAFSKGTYLNQHIKGKYKYRKVEE